MTRARMRRFLALMMTAVVTAVSAMPASWQPVYAAGEQPDDASPFGKNVAKGKTATVTAKDVAEYADGIVAEKLTDGVTANVEGGGDVYWEAKKIVEMPAVEKNYPMEIVIDLQESYIIDHVDVHWKEGVHAVTYDVCISENGESWTTVCDEKGIHSVITERESIFDPSEARFVKLDLKENFNYNTYALSEIEVFSVGTLEEEQNLNQALNKEAKISGETSQGHIENITDGNVQDNCEWKTSEASGVYYCYIDLGKIADFNQIEIHWTAATPRFYTIAVATEEDAVSEEHLLEGEGSEFWTTKAVYGQPESTATGPVPELTSPAPSPSQEQTLDLRDVAQARYVRLMGEEARYYPLWGLNNVSVNLNRDSIPVRQVYLSEKTDILCSAQGEQVQLYAQAVPVNADDNKISWNSDDEQVATVDGNGLVTIAGQGTAKITATAGGQSASVNVRWLDKLEPPVVSAALSGEKNDSIEISWDAQDDLIYELWRRVNGIDAAETMGQGTSPYTDSGLEKGSIYSYKVRAYRVSDRELVAESEWSEWTEAITIPNPAESISLDQEEIELMVRTGQPNPVMQLTANVTPENTTDKITWESDDEAVATVNESGLVTGIAKGEAKITATADSGRSAECTVVVKENSPYAMNVAYGKTVTVSTKIGDDMEKAIVDGNLTTLWEAEKTGEPITPNKENPQWVQIDLGTLYDIDNIRIHWHNAPASDYAVMISENEDEASFQEVGVKTEAPAVDSVVDFPLENVTKARYVKVKLNKAQNYDTYNIYEIEVFTPGTVNSPDEHPQANSVLISEEQVSLNKDDIYDLFAQQLPANADAVTWTSNKEAVATVNKGRVTAVGTGAATITATSGTTSASCQIIVTEKLATPENVKAVLTAKEQIEITWDAVEHATSYTIYRNTTAIPDVRLSADESGKVTYVDKEAKPGQTYTYQVAAENKDESLAEADGIEGTIYLYASSDKSVPSEPVIIPIHASGLSLSPKTERLVMTSQQASPTVKLTATLSPAAVTNQKILWKSSDSDVADVEDGVVTAKGVGTATITATSEDNEKAADTCEITVVYQLDAPAVSAQLTEDETGILVSWPAVAHAGAYQILRSADDEDYAVLEEQFEPEEAETIEYSDVKIESGHTYSYRVNATSADSSYLNSESEQASKGVFVPIHVESVAVEPKSKELSIGETLDLKIAITPDDASNKNVHFVSDHPEIASVGENGIVSAIAVGEAKITVTTDDGGRTAVCAITVTDVLAAPDIKIAKAGQTMTLVWNAVENAGGYDVFRSVDAKTYEKIASVTAVSYEDANLTEGTYYYKVVAKGTGYYKDSAESNVVSETIVNAEVKATGVALSKSTLDLDKGQSETLTATVSPADATNKNVTWSSDNTGTATVDANGKVTAVQAGTAVITATTVDGGKTASCTVTVRVPATKVTLNTKKFYIVKGKKLAIDKIFRAVVTPADSTDSVTWSAPKNAVVSIKKGKLVAGKKTGKAKLTATASSGKKATVTVYVVNKARKSSSVKLSKKKYSMKVGASIQLKAVLKPAKTTDLVKWKSSGKKVVSVDAFGTITAKKKGKATITATTTSGKKATCKITVK